MKDKLDDRTAATAWSVSAIKYMLGGTYRASLRLLNDAIIQNRIFGMAAILGCDQPTPTENDDMNHLTEELIKRNVLVLQAGYEAATAATLEAIKMGAGLREVCEATGLPPVWYMGSAAEGCKRILEVAAGMTAEGGLGVEVAALPMAGIIPGKTDEKIKEISDRFAASGIEVVLIKNPEETVGRVIEMLNGKREKLGINQKAERQLLEMKDRRDASCPG